MGFPEPELSPIIDKIIDVLKDNMQFRLSVAEFRQLLQKVRITKEDMQTISKQLNELELIEKEGKTIYLVDLGLMVKKIHFSKEDVNTVETYLRNNGVVKRSGHFVEVTV